MAPSIHTPILDATQLEWIVEQATRAPSVNNTQPWRFGWNGTAIDLHADLQRGLPSSDPQGRELVISCGAALYNLQLALRQIDRSSTMTAFPDLGQPRLLARVLVTEGLPVTGAEHELFDAIRRRHTRRTAFSDPKIRPDLAVRLQQAANSQDAQLRFVHEPGHKRQVLHLARAAERARNSSDGARAEIMDWTPTLSTARRDGVPPQAFSPGPPTAGQYELAARDFDLGRNVGTGEPAEQPTDGIAVLMTESDLATDWLHAGQALEAVLLTAAVDWAFATLHSQVTEVAPLRQELRREIGAPGYPQMLMRFGYATTAPTTPRRPAADVTDIADGGQDLRPYRQATAPGALGT